MTEGNFNYRTSPFFCGISLRVTGNCKFLPYLNSRQNLMVSKIYF